MCEYKKIASYVKLYSVGRVIAVGAGSANGNYSIVAERVCEASQITENAAELFILDTV